MSASYRTIIVASFRRSGTHLTLDALRRNFPQCRGWKFPGEGLDRLYVNLDAVDDKAHHDYLSSSRAMGILKRTKRPLLKTHNIESFRKLTDIAVYQDYDVIYVARHPFAVLRSLHRYCAGLDPETPANISDFLRGYSIDGLRPPEAWDRHVRAFYSSSFQPFTLQYENLVNSPEQALKSVADHFGLETGDICGIVPRPHASIRRSRLSRILHVSPEATTVLPRSPSASSALQSNLSAADRAFVISECSTAMEVCGYSLGTCDE